MKNIKEGSKEFLQYSHIFATKEQRKERLKICNSCDKMNITLGVANCSECGCLIKTKVTQNIKDCPLGKW